jgi:hypothetical protein
LAGDLVVRRQGAAEVDDHPQLTSGRPGRHGVLAGSVPS